MRENAFDKKLNQAFRYSRSYKFSGRRSQAACICGLNVCGSRNSPRKQLPMEETSRFSICNLNKGELTSLGSFEAERFMGDRDIVGEDFEVVGQLVKLLFEAVLIDVLSDEVQSVADLPSILELLQILGACKIGSLLVLLLLV